MVTCPVFWGRSRLTQITRDLFSELRLSRWNTRDVQIHYSTIKFWKKNRSFLRELISIREFWTHLFREQMNQFPVRVRNVEPDRDQRFVTAGRVCVRVQRVSGRTRKWELSTPLNALGCAEPSVSFTFVPPPSLPLTHETRRRCTFLPRHYHNFRQLPPT